jgi:hypothetical protein
VKSPASGGGRRWRRNVYISIVQAMAGQLLSKIFLFSEESRSRWRLLVFWDIKIVGPTVVRSHFYNAGRVASGDSLRSSDEIQTA